MNAAERYLASFPGARVDESPVVGLDVADVALHTALLYAPGLPVGDGIGYGATAEEARVGALGEMAEMALSSLALMGTPRVEASYAELARKEGAGRVQDPRTLALEAGSPYDDDRVLQWLPMTRARDGESVLVPAELVASSGDDLTGGPPPGGWLTTVITNGQGAGFDVDRAVAHAVLELLQRDGNGTSFRAMDRGVVVDLDGLADPDALAMLDRLDAAGIDVTVKLASTEFGVVNVYVVGHSRDRSEPVPIMATASGEAAHPDRDAAVRKALHEFASARSRKAFMHGPLELVARATPPEYLEHWLAEHPGRPVAEDRALAAMLDWTARGTPALVELLGDTAFARRSTVRLTDLPTWDGPDLHGHVVDTLHVAGFDVLVHLRPSDGDAVAAKVQVPGLEVETMSYGRIGERGVARLRERDDPLVAVGADPGGWGRVHLTTESEERLGGPAWFDREGARRRVGALYPLYREPGRHVVPRARSGT